MKYRIEMKYGVKPYAINIPRPIPIHQQQQVKEEIEKMIYLGVIQEVIVTDRMVRSDGHCNEREWEN